MRKLRLLVVGLVAASALSGAAVSVTQTARVGSHQTVAAGGSTCTMGWPMRGCGPGPTTT